MRTARGAALGARTALQQPFRAAPRRAITTRARFETGDDVPGQTYETYEHDGWTCGYRHKRAASRRSCSSTRSASASRAGSGRVSWLSCPTRCTRRTLSGAAAATRGTRPSAVYFYRWTTRAKSKNYGAKRSASPAASSRRAAWRPSAFSPRGPRTGGTAPAPSRASR